jgi:hypothetical protein
VIFVELCKTFCVIAAGIADAADWTPSVVSQSMMTLMLPARVLPKGCVVMWLHHCVQRRVWFVRIVAAVSYVDECDQVGILFGVPAKA